MLFEFIIEYHSIQNCNPYSKTEIFLTEEINEWFQETPIYTM